LARRVRPRACPARSLRPAWRSPDRFWLDFPDQWDPKSPWAGKRVRLAARLPLDGHGLHESETPGLSRPVGSIVPRDFEFALPVEAPPHDPARARKLLAEAGYPNGFD